MIIRIFVCVVMMCVLCGCATQPNAPSEDFSTGTVDYAVAPAPLAARSAPATESPAEPQPVKATIEPDRPATQAQRQTIYSADINLLAFNVTSVIDQVRNLATQMGGYMTALEGRSITVRIPAARFDELITQVARMGEVLNKHIKAADVTEELRDLGIRLENAERLRQRLLDHLKDATKMEDTLKIEAELSRVTESIEVMKGRQRYLNDQVAFSTVRVNVNSPMQQRGNDQIQIPFAWVREIGVGVASGSVAPVPMKGGFFDKGARFQLPKSYVRYYDSENLTQAMSADGMFIKLQRVANYDSGDVTFWSNLAKRVLKEQRSVAISEENRRQLKNGDDALVVRGVRDVGGTKQSYVVAMVAKQRVIHVFEAWGPAAQFERDSSMLSNAIDTLQTK